MSPKKSTCTAAITLIALLLTLSPSAQAQVRSFSPTPCGPGQVPTLRGQSNGTMTYGCGPAPFIAHSPANVHPAITCKTDADCPPGPGRCEHGYCMRGTIGCNADVDCKFSEFCDTTHPSQPFAGLCAPRGGHY